jgi:hypothetical protein
MERSMRLFKSRRTRQELYCHACDQYVQFVMDLSKDGNHVLECPNCKHEHCRVVKDGVITDIRWDQRNGPTHQIYTTTSSTTAVYTATSLTYFTSATSTWVTVGSGGSGGWSGGGGTGGTGAT